ncbi:MAG TPA: DUF4139 domain-containing protein [Phycisphaerae bacterium]|nr:DUF4139 domain-containing protein [Phycisphaerae bacterium]HOJ75871.1 DUF4139 domain-containing protein [Phycisphaerae bacterium]HOM53282.1 DUF4139 domain-containing protein [Phycisphaerae bacterium]HOQ85549.1 DUF4139 domain-containing protein [Phycisphaerae bacterium]HPP28407.1 DUF4139 domain-containing protein [Phycisphaerae bacterium]
MFTRHTTIGFVTAALLSAQVAAAQETAQPAPGQAGAGQVAPGQATPSTALTIYSTAEPGAIPPELYRPTLGQGGYVPPQEIPGYAVIKQERHVDLNAGVSTVRFTDVAARIEPTTVTFESLTDPDNTRVLEQSYQFDLVSRDKLMERFLDKQIELVQVLGDDARSITGTLLSAGPEGTVLRGAGGQVQIVQGYASAVLPELPGGLITRPTLVWRVAAQQAGRHLTRVTYQAEGITWWADYNVVFTEGENANSGVLDIGAWVSILNKSGGSYPEARLKLIAGDVHRAPKPAMKLARARGMMMDMAAAAPEAGFEEKAFFEYHLYTLGRPTTIPDNSTQQIELFPTARGVKAEKVLVYYGLAPGYRGFFPNPMTDRNFGLEMNKKVDTYLRFKNEKANGLGIPLPSGRIRVSKLDPADKTLEFIGEDKIDHTPRNEEVLIKMGSAFDVVGERRQVDFKIDVARNWMEETIEIKLRNHKNEPVKVLAKENLYRWVNWEIKQASHDYEKVDARTIQFPVQLKADEEAVITYTVRYTW